MLWRRRIKGPVCQCRHPLSFHYRGTVQGRYEACSKTTCNCRHYVGPLPEPELSELERWAQQKVRGDE